MKHYITRFLGGLIAFFGIPSFYGESAITDAYGASPAVGTTIGIPSGSGVGLCKLFGNSEYVYYERKGHQYYFVGWPNMLYKGTRKIWIDSPDWRKGNIECSEIYGYDSGLCWRIGNGSMFSDAEFRAATILPTSGLNFQSGVYAEVAFFHEANGTVRDRVLYSPSSGTFEKYGCCVAQGGVETGTGKNDSSGCPCYYGITDGSSGVYLVSGADSYFTTPILSAPYYDYYFINCAPGYYQESTNSVATTSQIPTRVIAGPGGVGINWANPNPCAFIYEYGGSPWCLTSGCVTTEYRTLSYMPGRCQACPKDIIDTNLSLIVTGRVDERWPYQTVTTGPFEGTTGDVKVLSSTVGITSCDIEFTATNTSGTYIYSCDKYTK